MHPAHSPFIRKLFPQVRAGGKGAKGLPDLPGIEIKECGKHQMFTIMPKDGNLNDLLAFLFVYRPEKKFFLVEPDKIRAKVKRGYRLSQIRNLAYFQTTSIPELKNRVEEIMEVAV